MDKRTLSSPSNKVNSLLGKMKRRSYYGNKHEIINNFRVKYDASNVFNKFSINEKSYSNPVVVNYNNIDENVAVLLEGCAQKMLYRKSHVLTKQMEVTTPNVHNPNAHTNTLKLRNRTIVKSIPRRMPKRITKKCSETVQDENDFKSVTVSTDLCITSRRSHFTLKNFEKLRDRVIVNKNYVQRSRSTFGQKRDVIKNPKRRYTIEQIQITTDFLTLQNEVIELPETKNFVNDKEIISKYNERDSNVFVKKIENEENREEQYNSEALPVEIRDDTENEIEVKTANKNDDNLENDVKSDSGIQVESETKTEKKNKKIMALIEEANVTDSSNHSNDNGSYYTPMQSINSLNHFNDALGEYNVPKNDTYGEFFTQNNIDDSTANIVKRGDFTQNETFMSQESFKILTQDLDHDCTNDKNFTSEVMKAFISNDFNDVNANNFNDKQSPTLKKSVATQTDTDENHGICDKYEKKCIAIQTDDFEIIRYSKFRCSTCSTKFSSEEEQKEHFTKYANGEACLRRRELLTPAASRLRRSYRKSAALSIDKESFFTEDSTSLRSSCLRANNFYMPSNTTVNENGINSSNSFNNDKGVTTDDTNDHKIAMIAQRWSQRYKLNKSTMSSNSASTVFTNSTLSSITHVHESSLFNAHFFDDISVRRMLSLNSSIESSLEHDNYLQSFVLSPPEYKCYGKSQSQIMKYLKYFPPPMYASSKRDSLPLESVIESSSENDKEISSWLSSDADVNIAICEGRSSTTAEDSARVMEENGENKIKKVINYSAMSTREMNSSNGTKGTNKNEKINKNNHNDNNNSSPTNNNNNNSDKQQLEEIRHQLGLMTVLLCKICARFNISASTLSSLNENDKGATTDKNELIFSTTINESDDVLQQVSGLVSALDSLISENRAFVKRFESSERSARELTSAGIKNDISAGQKATGNLSPATSALLRGGVFSVKPPSVAFERVLSFTDGDDRIFTSTPKTQRDEPINEVAESTPSEIAERRSDNCRRSAPRTINLTKDRRSGLLLPMGMSTRGPLQFPDVRDEANNSTTKTHLSEKCSQRQITASEKEKENRADGKPSWRETNRSHKHSSTPRITKKLFSRLNSKPLEGSDESEGDNQEARRISWMEEREATPSDPMTDNSSELIDAVVRSRNAFTPLPRPALTCHLCSEVLADNNARHLHNVRFHRSQLIESILCRDRSECDDESRPLNTDNNFIRSANSFENCQSESSIHVSIENNDDKNSDLSVNSERFSLSESEPRATPTPQPTRGEFDVSRFDISSRIERFNNNNSDNDRSACKTPSDFGQQQNSCKNRRRTGYDEKTTPSVREMVKSFHEKATTSPPTSSRKPAHQITGEVYGTPLPPSRKTVAVKRRDRRRGSASGSSSSSTTFNLNPFWNYVGCGRRISSCSFSSDEFARSYPGTNVVDSTPVSGTISGLQFLNSFANAALVLRGRQRQRIV